MRFLFSTGSLWSYSIERCFALAAQAGYDGLEIVVDQRWETRQAVYLQQLIRQHGLPVWAVHSPFWPMVPVWPASVPERILASRELAQAVGANVVVHHLPARIGYTMILWGNRLRPVPLPFNTERRYQEWLETAYDLVQAETDVRLCVENMPAWRKLGRRWNLYHWNHLDQITRFPHLTLDTTHLGTWGLEPAAVYPRLAGKVRHVHLSNFDGREHRRPETGHLRLDRFLAHLAATGYDGHITIEVYPEVLDAGQSDAQALTLMRRSLDFCRRAVQ